MGSPPRILLLSISASMTASQSVLPSLPLNWLRSQVWFTHLSSSKVDSDAVPSFLLSLALVAPAGSWRFTSEVGERGRGSQVSARRPLETIRQKGDVVCTRHLADGRTVACVCGWSCRFPYLSEGLLAVEGSSLLERGRGSPAGGAMGGVSATGPSDAGRVSMGYG